MTSFFSGSSRQWDRTRLPVRQRREPHLGLAIALDELRPGRRQHQPPGHRRPADADLRHVADRGLSTRPPTPRPRWPRTSADHPAFRHRSRPRRVSHRRSRRLPSPARRRHRSRSVWYRRPTKTSTWWPPNCFQFGRSGMASDLGFDSIVPLGAFCPPIPPPTPCALDRPGRRLIFPFGKTLMVHDGQLSRAVLRGGEAAMLPRYPSMGFPRTAGSSTS